MAFTGNIIYENGRIAADQYDYRVEGDVEANYGHTVTALLSARMGEILPQADYVRVHVYRDGLLIHVLKPRGSWYSNEAEYMGTTRFPNRILLKLED